MVEKFETGKKYQKQYHLGRNKTVTRVVECLWASGDTAVAKVLSCPNTKMIGTELFFMQKYLEDWEEFKEPVVHKYQTYLQIRSSGGIDSLVFDNYPRAFSKQLGVIEVTVTDGKLTDVIIVPATPV